MLSTMNDNTIRIAHNQNQCTGTYKFKQRYRDGFSVSLSIRTHATKHLRLLVGTSDRSDVITPFKRASNDLKLFYTQLLKSFRARVQSPASIIRESHQHMQIATKAA